MKLTVARSWVNCTIRLAGFCLVELFLQVTQRMDSMQALIKDTNMSQRIFKPQSFL